MCKNITVYFANGTVEKYYGEASISEKAPVVYIFPFDRECTTTIPLAQILKYEVR